jgi:phage-related protein
MIFEPLDFNAKLAAMVPKPRVNVTRFHGVFAPMFAPNSKHRIDVTHGFIKKSQKTPQADLQLAKDRKANLEK